MPTTEHHESFGRRAPVRTRLAGTVVATATALGLLFGLTAPSVSPVAPVMPNPVPVSAVVTQGAVAAPVPEVVQPQRDGRGRR